jgi:hypothetical protein
MSARYAMFAPERWDMERIEKALARHISHETSPSYYDLSKRISNLDGH